MRIRLGIGVTQGAEERRVTDGSRPAKPAANQRSADPSTIDSVPDARTVAARTRHCSGSPITAPVHSRAADSTRSGASSRSAARPLRRLNRPHSERSAPGGDVVGQGEYAGGQLRDTERSRRRRAAAVPGQVPAHHADVLVRRAAAAPTGSAADVPSDGPSSSSAAPRVRRSRCTTDAWNGHVASLR